MATSHQIPRSFVESQNVSRPEICPACPLSCVQLKPIIHRAAIGGSGVAAGRSGTGQIEWKDKVSALHIFECVHFPGRTHRRSRVRSYRGPTRVGNNNGHWPSAIPEYSALCYDDSIRQWAIPPDNALVKCTAVGEKGWLQNRGARRPLALPPRKSVGEVVPLFNRRDSFRAAAFSRASLDVRVCSSAIFNVQSEYIVSMLK